MIRMILLTLMLLLIPISVFPATTVIGTAEIGQQIPELGMWYMGRGAGAMVLYDAQSTIADKFYYPPKIGTRFVIRFMGLTYFFVPMNDSTVRVEKPSGQIEAVIKKRTITIAIDGDGKDLVKPKAEEK